MNDNTGILMDTNYWLTLWPSCIPEERREAEKLMLDKMYEIWEIYKKYNPDGKYLNMSIKVMEDGNGNDDGSWDAISFNLSNTYWADDSARQINTMGWIDLSGEKWDRCSHEVGDQPDIQNWRQAMPDERF